MIGWIDIKSGFLRAVHQRWCQLRGPRLMADIRDYNHFAAQTPMGHSACILVPNEGGPVFKFIGQTLDQVLPNCRDGMRFAEIPSSIGRTTLTSPFHRVRTSRQPDCFRGQYQSSAGKGRFEQLLLPFGNAQLKVCLVHAVYEHEPAW